MWTFSAGFQGEGVFEEGQIEDLRQTQMYAYVYAKTESSQAEEEVAGCSLIS